MLREVKSGHAALDSRRRWFADDYFELILWLDGTDALEGFQLCYDRGRYERAVIWTRGRGLRHVIVDQGESSPLKNQTPLLREGGAFDKESVLSRFRSANELIPPAIAAFVEQTIVQATIDP